MKGVRYTEPDSADPTGTQLSVKNFIPYDVQPTYAIKLVNPDVILQEQPRIFPSYLWHFFGATTQELKRFGLSLQGFSNLEGTPGFH